MCIRKYIYIRQVYLYSTFHTQKQKINILKWFVNIDLKYFLIYMFADFCITKKSLLGKEHTVWINVDIEYTIKSFIKQNQMNNRKHFCTRLDQMENWVTISIFLY